MHLCEFTMQVEAICALKSHGHRVVLVTSGAVSVGCQRMKLAARPKDLVTKQAVAAVGQVRLMRMYDDLFSQLDQPVAQVLLSRENINRRHHYTNASNTLEGLLKMGVVPIVNENDTVAVEELRVGDNDTLSALVASLLQADWLVLLTDVDALYTADPRKDPNAKAIHVVENLDDLHADVGSASAGASAAAPAQSGQWGTGGMATKLQAARIATCAGVTTVVTKSTEPQNVLRIIKGERIGTVFMPKARPLQGKKLWIAHGLRPSGEVTLDEGASRAVLANSSLFAAGIKAVSGKFDAQSSVVIRDEHGREIAKGIVNYASSEIDQIKGLSSAKYADVLGYSGSDEVISRDNLAITAQGIVKSGSNSNLQMAAGKPTS